MSGFVTFRVHGIPKGQPRARAVRRGAHAGVYDPGTANDWKSSVALAARQAGLGATPITGPVSLSIEFYLPRPKRLCTRKHPAFELLCAVKPDVDNAAKAVMDALTAVGAWVDDAQVSRLVVQKWYAAMGATPGACVTLQWGQA
jgi:crossover junction endodeoxyribonuclease RusA